MTRILVVRLGSLGDLVHTLPAVAAIRNAFPEVEIDWLVDRIHKDFLDLVPIISNLVTLDDRTLRAWLDAGQRLRARRYDVALDFQGLIKSAALARLSGAKRVMGFDKAALRESWAGPFYTEQVQVGEGRHVIAKNLTLAGAIGANVSEAWTFPLRDNPSPVLSSLHADGIRQFALLNCGAAWPNKRWPPDRFGRLADWLREHHALRSVVLWGPGEAEIAATAARASNGSAVVAPETNMADLVALSRAAALMVSGDTGPTHIAAAVGTPLVTLFGPTDARRNGPWSADDIAISKYAECDCRYQRRCHLGPDRWCLARIGNGDVQAAISKRLEARG